MLKQIREKLDLTQFELASAIGCSLSVVSKAEAGMHEPRFTIEQWVKFQEMLDKANINPKKLPSKLSDKVAI
ncbi:helix-turn-helix domain-containing protein [Picosynechococcus sp. PCC 8807]|uniref:helix-turn-helix domain-containing protein n=1 Tax=Picosynechococcus sp. PCC 8807 TaxID=195248 RepID=UPI0018DC188D|nr:helix-turn-helix transcriptional regulator [Picosynechococcus sp. PCC 8807]